MSFGAVQRRHAVLAEERKSQYGEFVDALRDCLGLAPLNGDGYRDDLVRFDVDPYPDPSNLYDASGRRMR